VASVRPAAQASIKVSLAAPPSAILLRPSSLPALQTPQRREAAPASLLSPASRQQLPESARAAVVAQCPSLALMFNLIYPSVHPSICMIVCLSIHPSIHPSIFLSFSILYIYNMYTYIQLREYHWPASEGDHAQVSDAHTRARAHARTSMHLHTLALQYHGLGKLGKNVSRAEVGTNILHLLRRDDILAGISLALATGVSSDILHSLQRLMVDRGSLWARA
jgi:hypothetical protein